MSDYYTLSELKYMSTGTTLGDDHGDLWVKGIKGKWVHDSGSGLLECTAPPLLKHEPTEPPLSDEQARHSAPTLGELVQALRWFTEEHAAFQKAEDRRRVENLQAMIDGRIGQK